MNLTYTHTNLFNDTISLSHPWCMSQPYTVTSWWQVSTEHQQAHKIDLNSQPSLTHFPLRIRANKGNILGFPSGPTATPSRSSSNNTAIIFFQSTTGRVKQPTIFIVFQSIYHVIVFRTHKPIIILPAFRIHFWWFHCWQLLWIIIIPKQLRIHLWWTEQCNFRSLN